jgi:hypothetical protein
MHHRDLGFCILERGEGVGGEFSILFWVKRGCEFFLFYFG